MTEDTLAKIEQLTGVRDPAGVACEPFRQWVIEIICSRTSGMGKSGSRTG
ncbi:hypothetical protein ACULNC_11880 [Shigella flexneri]